VTWIKLHDGFAEHPKVLALSSPAFRLHVSALCFCGRNLTDGRITAPALRGLLGTSSASRKHVLELVTAGLWEADNGEHHVRDFLQWNRSKAEVEARRKVRSEAGKLGAAATWAKPELSVVEGGGHG
jgi:hypothetical protein